MVNAGQGTVHGMSLDAECDLGCLGTFLSFEVA